MLWQRVILLLTKQELTNIENSANGVKSGLLGMSQPLGDIIKKFATWYLVAGLVTGVINSVKGMIAQVILLDNAMENKFLI